MSSRKPDHFTDEPSSLRGPIIGVLAGGIVVAAVVTPLVGPMFAILLGAGHAKDHDEVVATLGVFVATVAGVLAAALGRGRLRARVSGALGPFIMLGSAATAVGACSMVPIVRFEHLGAATFALAAVVGLLCWGAVLLGGAAGENLGSRPRPSGG